MLSNHPRIRVAVYLLAIAAQVAAVFVRIYSPELGEAFSSTANILAAVAGVTALANVSTGFTEQQIADVATVFGRPDPKLTKQERFADEQAARARLGLPSV